VAHREIHTLNSDLERRVNERTAELRAAQGALLSKERLSTLGQLTATVAHELRNPLSSIRNTLFTLEDVLARLGEKCERPVARMERSIARCDGIIGDLLDYTRARDLRCRAVTADKWLEETLEEQSVPADVTVMLRFGAPDAGSTSTPRRCAGSSSISLTTQCKPWRKRTPRSPPV
jgi:signal transduction histidine kinase